MTWLCAANAAQRDAAHPNRRPSCRAQRESIIRPFKNGTKNIGKLKADQKHKREPTGFRSELGEARRGTVVTMHQESVVSAAEDNWDSWLGLASQTGQTAL